MKIAIDTTFFGHEEIRKNHLSLSTSIFTADILDVWAKSEIAKDITLIVNYNHEKFFREKYPQFNILVLKFFPLSLIWKMTGKVATKYLKKLGFFKRKVERLNPDVLWIPYSVDYTFIKTKIPTVATVHDIYPVHKKGKKGFEFITDEFVTLTTVSSYTKDDILRTFETQKNIAVVPNSIVFDVSKKAEVSELADKKYILDLNAYIDKKNPMTLLRAFSLIKDKTDFDLVFCGGYKEENCWNEIHSFITAYKLENRVHTLFRVTDEERNWLLTNASIFVTPSLFEGFGRTPVEAAICRIPVISTKETSLYGATQGLCNYVKNPKDADELAELIMDKIQNPDSKEKLAGISESLKNGYNSENCANKYIEIFNNQAVNS
ncbi:MAG: glycosyltransferase [Treponema sp.]|nr:glycosyltransferase [Treponema sp.]